MTEEILIQEEVDIVMLVDKGNLNLSTSIDTAHVALATTMTWLKISFKEAQVVPFNDTQYRVTLTFTGV